MNAIGYVRVSTAEQAVSGLGLEDQRQRIEAYCRMRGLKLVKFLEDNACSGGKPLAKRPGGQELLAALRRHEADSVVVLKLDRAFRNAADCLATVEGWERKGVTLHIVDLGGNAIDSTSAAGKFMLTVLAATAEMERNLASERTKAAMAVKRQRGERISGEPPYGYWFDAAGKLQPSHREQEAIGRMTTWRGEGLSLREIASRCAHAGLMSRNGQVLSAKTVREILKREDSA